MLVLHVACLLAESDRQLIIIHLDLRDFSLPAFDSNSFPPLKRGVYCGCPHLFQENGPPTQKSTPQNPRQKSNIWLSKENDPKTGISELQTYPNFAPVAVSRFILGCLPHDEAGRIWVCLFQFGAHRRGRWVTSRAGGCEFRQVCSFLNPEKVHHEMRRQSQTNSKRYNGSQGKDVY